MKHRPEDGFTMIELMVATAVLLIVLSAALYFFSHSQTVYSNERVTLDMVQDTRTAFDRFTNEIRMAGAGLPGYHGVVSGTTYNLIVRGDFNDTSTIVTSTGANTGGVFTVGTTRGFAVGQTVSLLNTTTGASALAKITAIDSTASTITLNSADLLPITAGAQIGEFGAGSIINVIERRTYTIKTGQTDLDRGAVTRTLAYENTQSAGTVIQAEEVIARNLLNANGAPGLTFTYLDATDNVLAIDPVTGYVDPSKVAKVRIELQARTAERDLDNGKYRTLKLTALVQVRGQYIPAIGF
jgi:prepilin-type N-terminal cleavage/methylation domain-containing protein